MSTTAIILAQFRHSACYGQERRYLWRYHGPGLTVAVKSILESWNRTHHACTLYLHGQLSSEHGGPLYRPPGIPVLVGSDTFGRVHSGIPTQRPGPRDMYPVLSGNLQELSGQARCTK